MRTYNDFPTKPIGGGNPYYCCAYCEVSVPQLNGELNSHRDWCEYRKQKVAEEEIELLRLEIECLKLDLESPVYCVMSGYHDYEGGGEDIDSLKIFRSESEALEYKKELESLEGFNPNYDHVEIIQRIIHQG